MDTFGVRATQGDEAVFVAKADSWIIIWSGRQVTMVMIKKIKFGLVIVAALLATAAAAQRPILNFDKPTPPPPPEYVTAWPKQVPVLKPDPVMGEAKVWEYWVYDKAFAERFKNFDPARANPQMTPGIHAIVFRAYKEKVFDPVPELFRCGYEIYFDSRIKIPLSEVKQNTSKLRGQFPFGYQALTPSDQTDAQHLKEARVTDKVARRWSLLFADGALDGRYVASGFSYIPDLVPGLSVIETGGGISCRVLAPKKPGTAFWFSLFGEGPYRGEPFKMSVSGQYSRVKTGEFTVPNPNDPVVTGYVRMPEELYEAVLPKVTLIKSVNQCIDNRNGYAKGFYKDKALFSGFDFIAGIHVEKLILREDVLRMCDSVEQQGVIHDFVPYPKVGLQQQGFGGF